VLKMVSDQGYSRVFFGFGFVSAAAAACKHWGSRADEPSRGSRDGILLPKG
jgi:hypothetical protein